MMNKFKLFLILILSTILCIPKANAIVNMDGSIFTQAPQLNFYDNTRGTLTSVGSSYYDTFGYWVSNDSLITTGANTDGVNVTFTANEGFVGGYTYSLSILIGTESSRAKPSSSRICIAENITNANIRFQTPSSFPCTNAITITSMDGLANFDFGDISTPMTILTYVFTADTTSPTITLTYNTISGNNSRHLFGGYHLEVLSDNKTGVSANQVQSIINNSGLASADSVEELQTEIDNVKQDINNAGDAIVNSNKETQDVIKDQFNSCRDSINLAYNAIYSSLSYNWATLVQVTSTEIIKGETYTISVDIDSTGDSNAYWNETDGYIPTKYFTVKQGLHRYTYTFTALKSGTNIGMVLSKSGLNGGDSFTLTPSKIQIQKGNVATKYEEPNSQVCTNKIDETNDKLNETNQQIGDLNNNITSSDTSSSEGQAGSFFEGFETDDYGLSDIVTMPLQLINTLTNNTCVSLKLTLPFVNQNFELPCMSSIYQRHFGTFFSLYQTITFGFTSYWIIVRIFNLVKDFKNPDHDEIEVLDL